MKTTSLILGLLAATSLGTSAATIVQTGSILNGPDPSATFPLTTIVPLAQFDSTLGTLTSVTLQIDGAAQANVQGTNDSGGPVTLTASLSGNTSGTFATGLSAAAVTLGSDTALVPSGGTHDFGTISGTDSNSNSQSLPTDLSAYIGTGTIDLTIFDTQVWGVTGAGDTTSNVTESQTLTGYTVTYTYIPEPSSLALLLPGLALLIRRKRA